MRVWKRFTEGCKISPDLCVSSPSGEDLPRYISDCKVRPKAYKKKYLVYYLKGRISRTKREQNSQRIEEPEMPNYGINKAQ